MHTSPVFQELAGKSRFILKILSLKNMANTDRLSDNLGAEIWMNRARGPLESPDSFSKWMLYSFLFFLFWWVEVKLRVQITGSTVRLSLGSLLRQYLHISPAITGRWELKNRLGAKGSQKARLAKGSVSCDKVTLNKPSLHDLQTQGCKATLLRPHGIAIPQRNADRGALPLAFSSSSSSISISRSSNTATRGVFSVILLGILKSLIQKDITHLNKFLQYQNTL